MSGLARWVNPYHITHLLSYSQLTFTTLKPTRLPNINRIGGCNLLPQRVAQKRQLNTTIAVNIAATIRISAALQAQEMVFFLWLACWDELLYCGNSCGFVTNLGATMGLMTAHGTEGNGVGTITEGQCSG
jgi:hypothetical protein